MVNDVMQSLVIAECAHDVKNCPGGLEDKLRAAMNAAKDHWMVPDKDTQLRGAIAAVMIHYGEGAEEYKRLAQEVEQIRKFSAFLSATQAGLSVNFPDESDDPKQQPIGIMKLWHEVAGMR